MLARGTLGNANQPSALLIAPTTSLVATVAMQEDAALRIQRNRHLEGMEGYEDRSMCGRTSNGVQVHIVHGTHDISFCPNQHRWNRISGVQLHTVHDNHIISRPASLRVLHRILEQILAGDSAFFGNDASSSLTSA